MFFFKKAVKLSSALPTIAKDVSLKNRLDRQGNRSTDRRDRIELTHGQFNTCNYKSQALI